MQNIPDSGELEVSRDAARLVTLTKDIDKAKVIAKLKVQLKNFAKVRIDGLRSISVWATLLLTCGATISLIYPKLFYVFSALAILGISAVISDSENHIKKIIPRNIAHILANSVSGSAVLLTFVICSIHVWDTGFLSVYSAMSLGIGVLYLLSTKYGNKFMAMSALAVITALIGMTVHIRHAAERIVSQHNPGINLDIVTTLCQPEVQISILVLLAEIGVLVAMNIRIAATIEYVLNTAPTVIESIGETVFAAEAFNIKQHSYDSLLHFLKTLQTVACSDRVGQFGDLDFSASIDSALEISGDFYDIHEYGDTGEVVFWVGDVCGKGANAGVVMSAIQSSMHCLLRASKDQKTDVVKLLDSINDMIYHVFNEKIGGAYMTTMSIFSYRAGYIIFTGEHENVILLRANGEKIIFDTRSYGAMIGIDASVIGGNTGVFEFKPGDKLVLYSDGFVEQVSTYSGKAIGFEAFMASASRYHGCTSEQTRIGIINDMKTLSGMSKFSDDATIMVVTR